MVIVVLPMQFAGSEDVIKRARCFGTLSLVKHDYDYLHANLIQVHTVSAVGRVICISSKKVIDIFA